MNFAFRTPSVITARKWFLLLKSRVRTLISSLAVAALVVVGVAGTITTTSTPASADVAGAGGLFTPLQAYVLDTRHGVGGYPVAAFAADQTYSVGIDGQGGVPTSNVAAVQVTFTVPDATAAGQLYADRDGATFNPHVTPFPYLTYGTTQVSNTAVIPVAADGKIQVRLTSTADLIVNVQGYFTGGNAAGGGYAPLNATQVYNSGTTQYGPGQTVTFPVAGHGGIPANASSVMLDIIEANGGSPSGWLTAYPGGSTRPTSSLNWPAGSNYEWTTAVPMNSTGNITIYIGGGSGTVSLSVGVEGYFTASDGTTSAGEFTSQRARVFDSTSPSAPIASGASVTIPVAGIAGLPDMGSGIAAVAANLEISPGSGAQGHIQVFADDASPGQSAQQFYSGKSTFAFDVVSLGADGGITLQNSSTGTINVTVDVEGWYQAQALATPTISCPAPYVDGYASPTVPTAPVVCTVSVTNGTFTPANGYLDTYLDGVELAAQPFSSAGTTSQTVSVSAQGGAHSITSTATSSYGTTGTTASVGFTNPGPSIPGAFTVDPWVTVPDPSDADDPSATNFTPTLSATSSDVGSAETTTFEVRSAQDATAGSLVQTCVSASVPVGGTATCTVQPLAAGTYYVRSQATDGTFTSAWSDWSTLPVSSIVNTEVLPAAVVSCPSIANGQWDLTPPASSFNCQVTAPAAPSGSGSMNITLDGQSLDTVNLATGSTTTTAVTIPAGAAGHDIETEVQEVTDGPATDSDSFTFGSGNWSDANLVPNIANGANSNDPAPSLWVSTDGAPLTASATIQYTLSTNADGSGVILTAPASPNPLDIPDGTLSIGTTYYWNAQVQGPNNYDGSAAAKTSPWFSFVATNPTAAQTGAAPASDQATLDAVTASDTPRRCGLADLLVLRGTLAPGGKLGVSGDGYTWKNSSQTASPSVKDGYGNPGNPEFNLVKAIRRNNPKKIYTEAIDYPASLVYAASVRAGASALIGEMNNIAKECPGTLIILAGHSQGADVIGEVLTDDYSRVHTQSRVSFVGAALVGNPTYWHGEKIDAAGNGSQDGIFSVYRKKYSLDKFRGFNLQGKSVLDIRSYCKAGDYFCQNNTSIFTAGKAMTIHGSYGDPATVSKEIAFLLNFVS